MAKARSPWVFRARFRRGAFGWKSGPARQRVKEAVAEIRRVARKDPIAAAEGAVLFLERVSPAVREVDDSWGTLGAAIDRAIGALVPILVSAHVEADVREAWLERLWNAYHHDDDPPYLALLGERWGELCVTPRIASGWADAFLPLCRVVWSPDPELRAIYDGVPACLSSLLAAGRHEELLELLESEPHGLWTYRRYGALALAALGRPDEAVGYALEYRPEGDIPSGLASVCEQILLQAGRREEAYRRFAFEAHRAATYLAWFRAIVRTYREKSPAAILDDLVAATPGDEGKWFAAAKSVGCYAQAINLARLGPSDPRTLTRAARDFATKEPGFAVDAGVCALSWMQHGYGRELTGADVTEAFKQTLRAAECAGALPETRARIERMLARSLGHGPAGGILAALLEATERS